MSTKRWSLCGRGAAAFFTCLACVTTPSEAQITATSQPLSQPAPTWSERWRLDVSRGGSAPIVWADSLLLVASLDRNVHLVSTGNEPDVLWKENFKGGFEASPILTDDRIYLAETLRGGRLVVLNRRTREIIWTMKAGDLVAPPVVDGSRVFTVSSFGEVKAFETSGSEVWTTELETRVVSAPVILDDRIVIAASDGRFFTLDPARGVVEGERDVGAGLIWGHPVMRAASPSTAIYTTLDGQVIEIGADLAVRERRSFPSRFYTSAEVDGDLMFLMGHEGTLWAYDWGAAEIRWRRDLEGTFRATPTLGDGFVVVANLAGRLFALDAETGSVEWSTILNSAVTSKPLARASEVYVMTERGTVYAFARSPSPPGPFTR